MDNQPAPRLFEALVRYKWSSLCLTLVIVAISVAVAAFTAPRGASAVATLALKAPIHSNEVGTDITGSDMLTEASFVRYVQQRALFLTSDRVLNQARTTMLNAPDLATLRTEVTATAATNGQSITVTVNAADQTQAEGIANAVVQAYRDLSRSDATAAANQALASLAAQRSQLLASAPPATPKSSTPPPASSALTQELAGIDAQTSAISVAVSQFGDGVTFADNAAPQPSVFGKDVLRDGAIGLALGVLVAAAVAWARADRDRRVRDAGDLHASAPEPILAEIAEIGWQHGTALPGPNDSLAMPSYQIALTGLRSAVRDGVVVVTAAGPRAGATTSTLHLATVAARDGLRVCVVDADTETHRLSELLNLNPKIAGFSQLATGAAPLAACIHNTRIDREASIWAVAAGLQPPGVASVFQTSLLEKTVAELRANYDLVLIDTPPIVDAPEIAAVVRESDAVLVVTRRGVSMDALDRTRERIKLLDGKIGGYLLTFAGPAHPHRRRPEPVIRGALR